MESLTFQRFYFDQFSNARHIAQKILIPDKNRFLNFISDSGKSHQVSTIANSDLSFAHTLTVSIVQFSWENKLIEFKVPVLASKV